MRRKINNFDRGKGGNNDRYEFASEIKLIIQDQRAQKKQMKLVSWGRSRNVKLEHGMKKEKLLPRAWARYYILLRATKIKGQDPCISKSQV